MKSFLKWFGLLSAAVLALQLFFVLRIATMALLDPQSTAFERSAMESERNQLVSACLG